MALWLGLLATLATGQAAEAPPRPEVAVMVLPLDEVRQGQLKHGRSLLELLGDSRWGRFAFADPALPAELARSCEEDRPEGSLDYCVRYYLTRAERAEGAPPTVIVAFDDRNERTAPKAHAGEMRVLCFGRGVVPANAEAQDTWLWPDSARLRGVRDWERDRDALAACIEAAASEPFTGLRQPDRD